MADNDAVTASEAADTTAATEGQATETQAPDSNPVPEEVRKALRKANKEAETLRLKLKEYEDRDKSDLQLAQEAAQQAQAELESLRIEKMRREVADEKGLTPAQARRLVGTTREELEADANDVLAAFPIQTKPNFGSVGQGATRGESAQRVYTLAEISDHEFWAKHKDDILLAQREGRIQVTN